MKILAIETSCDDTCVAIIETKKRKSPTFNILSNIVSSQIEIHKQYGGVYPSMAKREHQRNLVPVLERAIRRAVEVRPPRVRGGLTPGSGGLIPRRSDLGLGELTTQRAGLGLGELTTGRSDLGLFSGRPPALRAVGSERIEKILEREEYLLKELKIFLTKYQKPDIDAIAVTNGPGLDPCLWVGVNLAKALSYFWNLPIVPVNHIEAHILANWLLSEKNIKKFPAISLVVSGGHTQLILMKEIGEYKILGETRDDAAGECFDKTAKILGLDYPGGPVISAIADKFKKEDRKTKINLPRPMLNQKNYDFSFSGLKTAVLYQYQNTKHKSQKYKEEMCYEIQQAIIDVLIEKTIRASKEYNVKTIMLGGGVASNKELRKQLGKAIKQQLPKVNYVKPAIKFCSDNAVMVGIAGYFGFLNGKTRNWQKIEAKPNLRIK
ncbi:MAG: tRNA (adenosine(37)-N6)-threonylcarbamoyltransferase complex transferase subunit TsaD [Patescibacteria group bacterium]|nr:tRNA (adenosine(37)-N6)-threonylcarbamoyltransferase complex transferase subunit TsaD [Patescibacteria group bacterium]